MNIQELHEKKKAFETKLVEIIGKELSEFANEGVTITSIDVDFENGLLIVSALSRFFVRLKFALRFERFCSIS